MERRDKAASGGLENYRPRCLPDAVSTESIGENSMIPPRLHVGCVLLAGLMIEALKAKERTVKLIHRQHGGHSTNYADATEAFEFVIMKLSGLRELR